MAKIQLNGRKSDFLKIVVAAAGRGDLETVCDLVDENASWVNQVGPHGRTMLWEAVRRGKRNVVEFLVERGADVNARGAYWREGLVEITPYCLALSMGRHKLAEYMLANGAKVDIFSAAYLGDNDKVVSFLSKDKTLVHKEIPLYNSCPIPPDWPYTVATPLHYTLSGGYRGVAELLIYHGAAVRPHSQFLLDIAVARGRIDLVKVLLENGVDATKTVFHVGWIENRELARLLLANGADVNYVPLGGYPAIVQGCRGDKGNHPEKIQALLDYGADVNAQAPGGKSALHVAAKAGFIDVMEILLEHDAYIDGVDDGGETPLFYAVRAKKKESVSFLIAQGADIDLENHEGVTPLKLVQRMKAKGAKEIPELFDKQITYQAQ